MHRPIAALVALALALPAQAGSDEQRRRNVAGLLGLGVLGAIIANESNKARPQAGTVGQQDVLTAYGYAIEPCVHHARALAGQFELSAVRRIELRGPDTTVLLDGRTGGGTSRVSCQVRGGRVVAFGFV